MTKLEQLRAFADFAHTELDRPSGCSPATLAGTTTVDGATGPATLYWQLCGGEELLNVRWSRDHFSHREDVNSYG